MALLSAIDISKRFGGVTALDEASFSCEAGEIHALLGGNGAGKSTMVKIICGVVEPDEGTITLDGQPVAFGSPARANAAGIIPVFQELSLVPDRTIAENLFLQREPTRFGFVDRRAMRQQTTALLASLEFPAIDPDVRARDLPLADRQLVEIAKAISRNPRVLVLDEATSALGAQEVIRLFRVVHRLREQGAAVIFISHRMEEVRSLCDRATIFRDGKTVGTVELSTTSNDTILQMMVGRELREVFPDKSAPPEPLVPALEVERLTWEPELRDISFTVNRGELVGLAGLEGQGQGELLFALFGVYAGVSGTVRANGKPVTLKSPRGAMSARTALIPEDRKTQGLILPLTVETNMLLPVLPVISKLGVVDRAREAALTGAMIDQLAIKTPSADVPVANLSGGNQQKTAIAKWLLTDAQIYLMYDPTRGIDVATKHEIYRLLRELAERGAAILLFSTDTAELIGLCDRALVMYEGAVVRELTGTEITRENLISSALGMRRDELAHAIEETIDDVA
jgi:ribose transport system ATP-binding protein